MPSGYKKAGNDLDNLLEAWQAGDGFAAATGYKVAGIDLNQRYAPASAGSGYTGGTQFKQNGADIGPRFCAKGARTPSQTIAAFIPQLAITIPNGWVGVANTSYPYVLDSDGTGSRPRGPTQLPVAFNWTSDGAPPLKDYEVRLSNVVVDEDNAAWTFTNNTGGAWVALDSTHGATVATLKFGPSSNGGQGNYAAHALLEIREKATGVVVKSSNMNISGTAQNA